MSGAETDTQAGFKATPAQIEGAQTTLRAQGMCGEVSDDSAFICIKDAGHDGPHGDERFIQPRGGAETDTNTVREALEVLRAFRPGPDQAPEARDDFDSYLAILDSALSRLSGRVTELEQRAESEERRLWDLRDIARRTRMRHSPAHKEYGCQCGCEACVVFGEFIEWFDNRARALAGSAGQEQA